MADYLDWFYYPSHAEPPDWVADFIGVVRSCQVSIESRSVESLTSDQVLAVLRPGLTALGYEVEAGKNKAEKIGRRVLFGDRGTERVAYERPATSSTPAALAPRDAPHRPCLGSADVAALAVHLMTNPHAHRRDLRHLRGQQLLSSRGGT